MPITINQLLIKASVDIGGEGDKSPPPAGSQASKAIDRKGLIEACVEEVLKVLERKGER